MPTKSLFKKLFATRMRNQNAAFNKKMGIGQPPVLQQKKPAVKSTLVKEYK